MFLRVYRLKIDNSFVHSVMLVLSIQLWDLYSHVLPLSLSLWFNPPPPSPISCVNKYTAYMQCTYTRIQCVRTGASEGTFSWGLKQESAVTCVLGSGASKNPLSWRLKQESAVTCVPGSGASKNPLSWGLKQESEVITCVPGSPTRERGFLALYSPSMWW